MPNNNSESIHSGHRSRLRKRFLDTGLGSFNDHEILELLLFHSIPRKDTNPLGHALMDKYKDLSAVFDADLDDLLKTDGISYNSAALIKLIPALCNRYVNAKQSREVLILKDTATAISYAENLFLGSTNESFYIICLDNVKKIISCEKLFDGSFDTVPLDMKLIANTVTKVPASRVILTHNHPQSVSTPSIADVTVTRRIGVLLHGLNIYLDDHIIISNSTPLSMSAVGILENGLTPVKR